MLRRIHKSLGFTLVELLVVVVLIALLVTIGLVAWRGIDNRAFNTRVVHAMTSYRDAFALYATQEKQYPAVPRSGSYCLHYAGLTGAEINSRWSSASKPATITASGVTETSYFCRDFLESASHHASYPPLTRALESISKLDTPDESNSYLIDTYSGGVWVQYTGTAASSTITIYGFFAGSNCPTGTVLNWSNGSKAICYLRLERQYPVNYTGESWPYNTA